MSQLTLSLDQETENKLNLAAHRMGISPSQWIMRLIQEKIATQWPNEVSQLAGAWQDFPSAETLRGNSGQDTVRGRATALKLVGKHKVRNNPV